MYDNLEIFWSCYCIRYLWWNVINPKDRQTKKKIFLVEIHMGSLRGMAFVFSDIQIYTVFCTFCPLYFLPMILEIQNMADTNLCL